MAENTRIKDMQANNAKLFEMTEITMQEQKEHRAQIARVEEANCLRMETFQTALENFMQNAQNQQPQANELTHGSNSFTNPPTQSPCPPFQVRNVKFQLSPI